MQRLNLTDEEFIDALNVAIRYIEEEESQLDAIRKLVDYDGVELDDARFLVKVAKRVEAAHGRGY